MKIILPFIILATNSKKPSIKLCFIKYTLTSGSVAIFKVNDDNDSGELGYSLGSKWWGNGYMTEAVSAVIDYAFNKVGFNRIYASCHEENIASKKVMEKLSMTYEGLLRDGQRNLDNTYSNLSLYTILKRDYKK